MYEPFAVKLEKGKVSLKILNGFHVDLEYIFAT